MVEVKEVTGKKDIKAFIELPLKMYKDCPYFVPPLYSDEKKLLLSGGDKDGARAKFFLAYKDGALAGRIQCLIQENYNKIHNTRQARFTRFDAIDDPEVAKALFAAAEAWAEKEGMTEVCGPLGYSDLDREGLLIEGFDEVSTFEEQYNYDYYPALVESAGYVKDADWLEYQLRLPEKRNEMLKRVADRALEMNGLHIASSDMPKREYINKYRDGFFDCLDECYSHLYGTVPITKAEQDELISQFMLLINKRYVIFICDKNDRVVGFGLCFPGMGEAVQKSGGRLTPAALLRLLRAVRKPKCFDLGLVAIRPEYQKAGINAVMINGILDMLESGEAEYCETNLNLESNTAVQAQWKYFDARQHKRRRSYIKRIGE